MLAMVKETKSQRRSDETWTVDNKIQGQTELIEDTWCIHPISRYSDPWTSPDQLHLITFRISDAPFLGKIGEWDQEGRPLPTRHNHHYTDYITTLYNHETAANEEIFEHYQVIHIPWYSSVCYGWVITPLRWRHTTTTINHPRAD